MFKSKIFALGLGAYLALRLFSYYFTPTTPLLMAHPLNSIVAILVLTLTIYLLIKKNVYGWYLVAGEIVIGGGGNFLEIIGISLRTWILVFSLGVYFFQIIKHGRFLSIAKQNFQISVLIFSIFFISILASARGLYLDHSVQAVWSDFLPYIFLFYYFPLRELLSTDKHITVLLNLLLAGVVGNFIIIIVTFIGFNTEIFVMQDLFYHWYRDVLGGKITPLPFNFFRLVLNEQLLLIPLVLLCLYKIIKNVQTKFYSIFILPLLYVLSLNLTRIYILALVIGILVLFSKSMFKRWALFSTLTLFVFFSFFTLNHIIASRGQSLGWEIFGLRLQSITSPQIEDSSLSRLLLLPKIIEKIRLHPIIGTGLGDVITVYSPVVKKVVVTPAFDWGYLEIWAEMGLYGLFTWLIGSLYILRQFLIKNDHLSLSILVALVVINLTSPALFHVFGIILITVIAASFSQKLENRT